MICRACQWSGEASGVRSPRPITIRGRCLRKTLGQGHAGLEGVEQAAVGQIERHAELGPQHVGRGAGLGQADLRAGRGGRRLAVGQIDNAHAIALPGQPGQRAAAGNFHVVGMRPDGNHIQGLIVHAGHYIIAA